MRDQRQLYLATNKEIHDLLLSAKQKVTESVLHELLRDRGIICSPQDSRDHLAQYLSLLPHDYSDVRGILDRREASKRGEKTTAVAIDLPLSQTEIAEVIGEYQRTETHETIRSHKKGAHEFVMNITYSDFDYSKTKLLQRQDRDAEFVFSLTKERTEVRMPATDWARSMMDKLKERIEAKKKRSFQLEEIELTGLETADERTMFFTDLISSLPQFPLLTVSRLRVAHLSAASSEEGIDIEDEEVSEIEEQMLGIVDNVALTGENLVASEMYQELKAKGFFITSITWRARQKVDPYTIIECDAGFEDRQAGKKFRYSVHGALSFKNGRYTKNIRPVGDDEKAQLLAMIEQTARGVLAKLRASSEQNGLESKK